MSLTIEAPQRIPGTDTTPDVVVDDRRTTQRVQRPLFAEVRPVGLTESHRCNIEDISEGGLFILVPLSYGLNVGQRCEIQFVATQSHLTCTSDSCYATVVRTEVIASDAGKQLGAGLRFDQPLFL